MARSILTLSLVCPLIAACATASSTGPGLDGSTVTYEPARKLAPDGPPARLPSAPAFIEPGAGERHVVEVRGERGSVVRYEPILDDEPIAHEHAPIEDEPDEAEGEDDAHHELALEDRGPTAHADAPVPSLAPRPFSKHDLPVDPRTFDVHLTPDGLAYPYPTLHMFRGFGACRGRRHHHEAIDLGGVGPNWGIGTPIRSMAKAEVTFVGRGADNPDDFGTPDTRDGEALRGDRHLPRSAVIPPYGEVHFFTSKKGRWRSGNLVVTRVLEGPLAGHTIRYLHVAAIHPDVRVGGVVGRGQEIALMGGTGVQDSAPHLHLDIQAPDGRRLDVAPLLGLAPTATCRASTAPPRTAARADADDADADADDADDADDARPRVQDKPSRLEPPAAAKKAPPHGITKTAEKTTEKAAATEDTFELRRLPLGKCRTTSRREDFSSGRYREHTTELSLKKGQKLTIEVGRDGGTWKPRLQLEGDDVNVKTLATGKIGAKAASSVTATADTTVRVTVGGWGQAMPDDARYTLSVADRCTR